MLTRIDARNKEILHGMFRFDIAFSSTSWVDWGSYLIAQETQCYIMSIHGGNAFFVPNKNFFLMMKLACVEADLVTVFGYYDTKKSAQKD